MLVFRSTMPINEAGIIQNVSAVDGLHQSLKLLFRVHGKQQMITAHFEQISGWAAANGLITVLTMYMPCYRVFADQRREKGQGGI